MKKKKLRPYGEIQLDLEKLYQEAVEMHDIQLYTLLHDLYGWAHTHNMGLEEYNSDGSNPKFFYGHKDEAKKWAKKL